MNHLVAIGFGYSARRLAGLLAPAGWQVTGTSRSAAGVSEITAAGFRGALFAGDGSGGGNEGVPSALAAALEGATHVLVSAPPTAAGDPVLACLGDHLAGLSTLGWVGYFSTVGVYGDRDGGWVDETTPAAPTGERGRRRLAGETAWRAWGERSGKTVLSLRLQKPPRVLCS